MRKSALIGTVHFSTQIEGNPLPEESAAQAVAHRLVATNIDERELVNYVNALDFIDRGAVAGELDYSSEFILRLHKVLTDGLGSETARPDGHTFRPDHEGAWRDGVVQIKDEVSGQVKFVGPHPDDVPLLMESYSDALERSRGKPAAVLAGLAHWGMTDIHPFADGNGRMARLMTVAVLVREGFLKRRLFSFERYYARDREAYFDALRSGGSLRTLNAWLDFFLEGLGVEYEEVARKVIQLEQVARQLPSETRLRPIESRVLLALVERRQYRFTRAEFQAIGQCSDRTAKQSLSHLVEHGVVRRVGRGPATAYVFARSATAVPRTRRRWTDERIRAELREFTRGRDDFPTVREFTEAGRKTLYEAIARYGGADRWAAELELRRGSGR
jgi:Fic family protein